MWIISEGMRLISQKIKEKDPSNTPNALQCTSEIQVWPFNFMKIGKSRKH